MATRFPLVLVSGALQEMVSVDEIPAALVGFLQAGSGAVLTTLQAKLQDSVSVLDFMTDAQRADVRSGAMTLDVVSAFNAALATGRPVYVPSGSGWVYKIGAAISIPSNSVIYGNRSKIFLANGSNSHVVRIANGASNVEIRGLHLDGNKANNTGGHGIVSGGAGCWDIRIINNYVKNCAVSGIFCSGTDVYDIEIRGNSVEACSGDGIIFSAGSTCTRIIIEGNKTFGNGIAGISGDNVSSKVRMDGNTSWLNNTHGIGFLGVCTDSEIVNNLAYDNGQGDPTADNITAYNSAIDNLLVANNVSRGGLNNGIHIGGNRVVVTGNTVIGATQYGIAILAKNSGGTVTEMTDFVVANNIATSCGLSGFWLYKTSYGSVTGNVARSNSGHGFAMDEVALTTISGNTASNNTQCGFKNEVASVANTYNSNIASFNGSHGFELKNVTVSNISGNNCRSNTGYGIFGGGTASANTIVGNSVRLNTAGDISAQPVNTRIVNNDIGTARTIPSAATLTLPTNGDYFYITGTTNITSIASSWTERRVTLQFADVLIVTDGGNLNMAGNFVTALRATISYIFDGTNWVETSRSLN
jgi:parallel beta-helix repeat protein